MTTEEKARAYDEALEDMRVIYPNLHGDAKLAVEHAFPILAESEDERMLRTIIRGFENWKGNGNVTFNNTDVDDILAYLEKQKLGKIPPYVTDSPGDPGNPGEPGISDLEEAAKKYAHCPFTDDDGNFHEDAIDETAYRDFIAGAEWHEQQMMKDAVEAEITVGRLPDDWSLAYNPDELHRALLKFKSGDKVKIIIVKQ